MQFTNPLTQKRVTKDFAKLIVDTMRHENISLLEAYVGLSHLMTSDEVLTLAKEEISKLNGVEA